MKLHGSIFTCYAFKATTFGQRENSSRFLMSGCKSWQYQNSKKLRRTHHSHRRLKSPVARLDIYHAILTFRTKPFADFVQQEYGRLGDLLQRDVCF